MIVPLPGGNSATLRERLTYSQGRAVRAAFIAVDQNPAAMADLDLELVKAFVSSWHVLDLDGNSVGLDEPEKAPDDVIQAISLKCFDIWRTAQELPKGGGEISPSSQPEPESKDSTPTSPTRSSLSTIQGGAGTIS